MNKNSNIKSIDALSLSLVLSFLIIHNIYIVLIGIILSLYSINEIYINKLIKLYKIKITLKGKSEQNKTTKAKGSDNLLTLKDQDTSLVEQIEQLGYIPSLTKTKDDEVV